MSNKTQVSSPLAHFITMGCAKNEVDTRNMKDRLFGAGIGCIDDIDHANIVIINTCSFIQAAVEENIDVIFDVLNNDRILKEKIPVIVTGCMPARYGDELSFEFSEVASFLPCSKEDDIVLVVKECLGGIYASSLSGGGNSCRNNSCFNADQAERALFAYVKISDGCDRFCSYCTIPIIRGRYHSFPIETIKEDIRSLSDDGVKEIVLIGQDTGIWGHDLEGDQSLATLLDDLSKSFPNLLFRVMYTQPEHINDDLLQVMRDRDNIASYLDIPFQHCCEHILRDMNRKGSASEFLSLIENARAKVPDLAIRTTLMVGFPGETENDFEQLETFVEEAAFEYVGLFAYSCEEGTKAASMTNQVNQQDKDFRLSRLRDVADSVSAATIANRIGNAVDVLIEGIEEDGQLFGRSFMQAPEVDGVTFIDSGSVSEVVKAEVVDTLFYDMEVERA